MDSGLGFGASIAIAEQVSSPEVLEQSGARPVTLTVIEPHLGTPEHPAAIDYVVFPASVVLSAALGPDWATKAKTIEFRALDGYVSRIDAARLRSKRAYMAFARADHSPFSVDNLAQNEQNIPLGPYYLVWDNREDPELLSEGARNWPYQVIDVSIFNASEAALRPPGFNPALEVGLSNVKANCLTCHKVNGFGGEKSRRQSCSRCATTACGRVRQMDARTVLRKTGHNHARPSDEPRRSGTSRDRPVDL